MISERLKVRIRHVCSLKAGWLDGDGDDIRIDADQLIRLAGALVSGGYPEPLVVPTPGGLVQFEWADGLSVEIHTMPPGWRREIAQETAPCN